MVPLRISSRTRSAARHASAMIVSVGFLSAFEANTPPSATKRFRTSHACDQEFVTEFEGADPMMVPPTSWMMEPPGSIAFLPSGLGASLLVHPIARIQSANVLCMWATWRISCSDHFQLNRRTGIPHLSTTLGSISQYESSLGIISPLP